MIQDATIQRAVSRILQRSERQIDQQKLVASFVDVGILPQLLNSNNQIFYGRRGTGKTHVLRVLQTRLKEDGIPIVVYIDARTLGSTSQFSDSSISIPTRCLALFRDILCPIHDALHEHIIENPPKDANKALEATDRLIEAIMAPTRKYLEKEVTRSTSEQSKDSVGTTAEVAAKPKLDMKLESSSESKAETKTIYEVSSQDKVVFPALHDALREILELSGVELFVLLDEWSSLPTELQPYLAEFLKRGILPVQRATLKIAALEHRSRFTNFSNGVSFGFEVGADISTAPDLDDYYVFDRNPEQLTNVYSDMLLRHLQIDLPDGYLQEKYNILTGANLSSRLFTERATFKELARAAEGVVRDLINIFTQAFFHAHRRGRETIDLKAVVEGARQWFEQDKQTHLDEEMQLVLRKIVDEVIGKRKARSFLLPRELQRHPMIQKLFDSRVLHPMQRGYADKDNPGVRYNIYSLDYGTYVDLMGTSRQPETELLVEVEDSDTVVPFDDKRSIRRIVLNQDILGPPGEVRTTQ